MEDRSDSDNWSFLRFVIIATLKVVGMALLIMSGWVFYIAMLHLSLISEAFSYIAITAFWSFIVLLIVFAAVIDWMKKRQRLSKRSLTNL